MGVPAKKTYKLILDSDSEEFGGCGRQRPQSYKAVEAECDGRPYSIAYPLEPYWRGGISLLIAFRGLVKCEEQLNNGADMTDIYISYEWRIVLCAIFNIRLLYRTTAEKVKGVHRMRVEQQSQNIIDVVKQSIGPEEKSGAVLSQYTTGAAGAAVEKQCQ